MRFLALAADYDGTIAHDGCVAEETLDALRRFRESGRKLILVTGRELPDLERAFPHLDVFDRVVAENGAVLYHPESREKKILAAPPPSQFVEDLRARGVPALSVGDVVVATWRPHEAAILESIQALGLDLQVIFNKDAVMVLPAGVNKMTGLHQALCAIKLSHHNAAGIGDAQNDLAFLRRCECSAAVANALPAVKEAADVVLEGRDGAGCAEFISAILADDLRSVRLNPERHGILFGHAGDRDIYIGATRQTILLCGQSGGGKSTFVAGLVERLADREYQTCLIDPEGDYEKAGGFLTLGDETHAPSYEEIFQIIEDPASNLIVNLIGVKMQDRPPFFAALLTRLQEKKVREGRPHWLIVDEAHHLLPSGWAPDTAEFASQTLSTLLVTVHPEHVSRAVLSRVNILVLIGREPEKMAVEFARAAGIASPPIPPGDLAPGEATVWFRDSNHVIERMQSVPGKAERKRHRRKYAEGELEPERIFYFRGPDKKLNLRAQNFATFVQLAAGVDDETWQYHLKRGDYSNWLATSIKDADLAGQVRTVEQDSTLTAAESRLKIAKAIEERYTAPAG
jgi:HAD superfamily hydrolase (TIGR01484 family)